MATDRIIVPSDGEMTLIGFFKRMAAEIDDDERLVLNHLMRSLGERGWLPGLADLLVGLDARGECPEAAHRAFADLTHRRLLTFNDEGTRITSVLGTISVARTPHRGHLANSVDVFTYGGLDLLSLNTILARAVDVSSPCGQCQTPVTLSMEDEAIQTIAPVGAAGFQATWDGAVELAEVSKASNLFCSDTCLSTWTDENPDTDGLPIPADLLLHMGAMMAAESGNARFAMFGIQG